MKCSPRQGGRNRLYSVRECMTIETGAAMPGRNGHRLRSVAPDHPPYRSVRMSEAGTPAAIAPSAAALTNALEPQMNTCFGEAVKRAETSAILSASTRRPRSEERRVGKGGVRNYCHRWLPVTINTKQ